MDRKTQDFLRNLNKQMPRDILKKAINNDSRGQTEANKWMETKIKKAIKNGDISSFKKDPFVNKMHEKMKK